MKLLIDARFKFSHRTRRLHCAASLGLAAVALSALVGCGESTSAGTAEQRDLGEATLNTGLSFSLQLGTIDDQTDSSVRARASMPLPQFTFISSSDQPQQASLQLANIHRKATLQVLEYSRLSANSFSDCPSEVDTTPVVCAQSRGAEDAPQGCEAPQIERKPAQQSVINAEFELQPCTRTTFALKLAPAENLEQHFKVFGRAESLAQLQEALILATRSDPDFLILLGDIAENASLNGLRELDFVLRQADYPAVVLPGEREVKDGARSRFLSTFGPFDLRWDVGESQFYAFYSAGGALSERGVSILQRQLERLDPERPAFALTHTPPFDPIGPRDQGFTSELEAARTMSLLSSSGVDMLFSGHINAQNSREFNGVLTHLTSLEGAHEFLSVQVSADGEIHVEREAL